MARKKEPKRSSNMAYLAAAAIIVALLAGAFLLLNHVPAAHPDMTPPAADAGNGPAQQPGVQFSQLEDEEEYDTTFVSSGIEGDTFVVVFYHNASDVLPVWVEGVTSYAFSSDTAEPFQEITLTVGLVDGQVPNFRLHVGAESEVFEFGSPPPQPPQFIPPAPTGDITVVTNEETKYVFTETEFDDVFYDDEGHDWISIELASVTSEADLDYGGMPSLPGQEITKVDILSGLLSYTPAADGYGSPYDSFTFYFWDEGFERALDPTTVYIDVNNVNDAPEVTPEGNAFTGITEDDTANSGDTVSTITGTAISDADPTDPTGIAVYSTSDGNGKWQYSTDGGSIWEDVGSVDATSALLLGSTDYLRFVPDAQNEDTASVTWYAWDQSDGLSPGDYTGVSSRGGDTAFSTAGDTSEITVSAVNDAPTSSANTVTATEDTTFTFSSDDFPFTDVDTGETIQGIKITAVESVGDLEISGVDVSENEEIAVGDIGSLTFDAAANANGASYDSFEFQVYDGTEYSSLSYTMTIDVTAQQDAPTASSNTVTTLEDNDYVFAIDDFGFFDIDSGDTLHAVKVTDLEDVGSLTVSGVAVELNDEIAAADIGGGNLKFTPVANANGASYDSFGFEVSDGIDFSAGGYTMTIDVTVQNDAPTASDNTLTTLEDTQLTIVAADFGFSDIDAGDSLASVKITTLETSGYLKLDGVDVTLNQVIPVADLDANLLTFDPEAEANGASYDSFEFTVNDGTTDSVAPNTMTIDVTAQNDAPTASDNSIVTLEDNGYTFSAGDFSFSDVDSGDTLDQVEITTLPVQGELQLSGVPVIALDAIDKADLDASNLVFVPAANANGEPYATYTFKVYDGTDWSALAYTMTIAVTAQNDAPTGDNDAVTGTEDTQLAILDSDFTWSDVDGDPFTTLKIKTVETAGDLEYDGVDVTADQEIPASGGLDASKLTFDAAANENGAPYATFTFQVGDGTVFSVATYTMTININAANDPPTGGDDLVSGTEDTQYIFSAPDFTFSDIDTGDTFQGIKVISTETEGDLEWDGTDVSADDEIPVADIDNNLLTFDAAANANGAPYATYTFKVSDGTDYSVLTYTMTIDVTAQQDAPTASSNTVTTLEDNDYVFAIDDFGFFDIDSGDTLHAVKVTDLEDVGSLTVSGVAVELNDEIAAADIGGGNLKFTPVANANGASYDSFGFEVSDGIDFSAGGYTMTIDVTVQNDAPTTSANTVTTLEDTQYVFQASDFPFSDIDTGDTFQGIKVTALESTGDLEYEGVAVTQNQEISAADISSGKLTFDAAANANGASYDSFEFQVSDGSLYSSSDTLTIDVTEQNDAPTASDNTLSVDEDNQLVISTADFGYDDVDGDIMASIEITALETVGDLKLDGAAVGLNDVISKADLDASLLTFDPVSDGNGAPYDSFSFTVNDGTTDSVAPNTITINVNEVNDAPVLASASPTLPTITEDETDNSGIVVSDLVGETITDADSGAAEGIAIIATGSPGIWQFNTGGGWTNVGTVSTSSALLLSASSSVRLQPNSLSGGSGSITYYAWDQTAGSSGSTASATVTGGTTAFSSSSNTASITVTFVTNDFGDDVSGTVTVSGDISGSGGDALTVTADDTVISLGGHTVTGGEGYSCIELNGHTGVEIMGPGTISGCSDGIGGRGPGGLKISYLTIEHNVVGIDPNNTAIENCTFNNNTIAILFDDGHNNTVWNNTFENQTYASIMMNGSATNNTVWNNRFWNNTKAVYLDRADNITLFWNSFWENGHAVYSNSTLDCNISHNLIWNNTEGMQLYDMNDTAIEYNLINRSAVVGVNLNLSFSNTVHMNNISYNKNGLYLYGRHNNLTHNTISHNRGSGNGIWVYNPLFRCAQVGQSCSVNGDCCGVMECSWGSCCYPFGYIGCTANWECCTGYCEAGECKWALSFNLIAYNSFINNTKGLNLERADNETVENNTFWLNDHGIFMNQTLDCNFTGNTLYNNTWGIFLEDSNSSIFRNNTLYNNTVGVNISVSSDFNMFYHNEFNESVDVHADSSGGFNNLFNTTIGGVAQGNSWDDVPGLEIYDTDSSGYGDAGSQYPYLSFNGANVSGLVVDLAPRTDKINIVPNIVQMLLNATTQGNHTNETLYCWVEANDSEQASLEAYWQWLVDGTLNETGSTTVPNGTLSVASSISPGNTSKGEEWNCSVLLSDLILNQTSWENRSLSIRNHVPTHGQPELNTTTGNNHTSEDLLCWNVSTSDIDGEPVTNTYIWYRDNVVQPSLENATVVTSGNTSRGETWICEVTPNDGESDGTAVNSTPLDVVNVLPDTVRMALNTTSDSNYTTEDLYCWAEGDDGESSSLTAYWQWWVNGTLNETGSTTIQNGSVSSVSVLYRANTSADDEWNCSVLMSDSDDNETGWNNATLTVQGIPDQPPNTLQIILNSTNGNNHTNEDISCYAKGNDSLQSALTAHWHVWNGSVLLYSGSKSVTNGTLSHIVTVYSGNYTKGDAWKCSVIMDDGTTNESDWNNATLTIANAPPAITTSLGTVTKVAGSEFYHDYNASDPDVDDGLDTLTWSDNTGLFAIDSGTGEINDTPTEGEVGSYSVTITVSDGSVQDTDGFSYLVYSTIAPARIDNVTVSLTINNTSNMVYVPGAGAKPASQWGTVWNNPPHYYFASYSGSLLYGLVFAYQNPGFLRFSSTESSHTMSISMDKENSLALLAFTKGDWRNIEEKMGLIESYEFLKKVSPSFGYGLGLFQELKALLDYNNTLDIEDDIMLNPGSHSMIVEYVRDENSRPVIAVRRT